MAGKTRDIGAEILQGLREIKRGEVGRVINVPDVARTREGTGLTQAKFAQLLGVSLRTLQDWEQGRRAPSGAARTLLLIAAKNPQALLEAATDSMKDERHEGEDRPTKTRTCGSAHAPAAGLRDRPVTPSREKAPEAAQRPRP